MKDLFGYTLLIWISCQNLSAATVESPYIPPILQGNSSSPWPLLFDGSPSLRYQQVYAATDFGSLAQQGGGMITQIKFFIEPGLPPIDFRYDLQINLSTTTKAPDRLNTLFSANIGSDDTTVFPRQTFTMLNAGSIVIPLQHPFYYSGLSGQNLLLDVRNYGGAFNIDYGNPALDAVKTDGDSVSSVAVRDVTADVGFLETKGVVTEFTFSPVPEPMFLPLIGVGLVTFLVFRKKKRLDPALHKKDLCR
ncbi:MAG TPA: PEP-CTERM sorting domain-containing protein [Chitinophagaceae bacterium]|jgi:hypothetical protein